MRLGLIAPAFILFACSAAQADEPSTAAFAAALSAQPDVVITHTEKDGLSITEWRKNGVFYRREENATHDTVIGDDETGKGAVMCAWGIYVDVREVLNSCPADRYGELRVDLDAAIGEMEGFIVANSVIPVTIDALKRQAASLAAQMRATPPSGKPQACGGRDLGQMIDAMDRQGRGMRRKQVVDLLSTPRWPVSNPCL